MTIKPIAPRISITSKQSPLNVAVTSHPNDGPAQQHAARQLADQFSITVAQWPADDYPILLIPHNEKIELRLRDQGRYERLIVDWSSIKENAPVGNARRQPIAKAIGIGKIPVTPLTVVDVTAGLGHDAWLLALLGCRVTAIERSPIIAALLRHAHQHAYLFNPRAANRIATANVDARQILNTISPPPQVIYLDPMFPPKKKHALQKLPMRILRQIVGPDHDATELFNTALVTATYRVVVKRPLHADPIANHPPTTTHKGKSMRYDVYCVPK